MIITEKTKGIIKELNGVNCAPYNKRQENDQKRIKSFFRFAGIPRSRLHDCCGSYGGCYFVDVPNIFRDFDKDENDPESYDFHYTDEYIKGIIDSGANVVYRLGVTIEWGSKKYTSIPPKDNAKWARICEHIIMHYNKGWKDGFNYGIEYWEIWNEPENPPMWQGTKEQFFELYRVASTYLKARFPEIKIGGYGSSGFYAVFREGMNDFYKSFIPYFTDFLEFVKKNNCPLDFYSWHIYTDKLSEIKGSSDFVREKLDEYGFKNTESHLNEWNYGREGERFADKHTLVGASFVAAAFALMQSLDIDLAQYYVATAPSTYNGLMDIRTSEPTCVAHVFASFAKIFKAGNELYVEKENGEPYCVAAENDGKIFALLSNYELSGTEVNLEIVGKKIFVSVLTDSGFEPCKEAEGSVTLQLGNNTVYSVTAE